MYRTDSPLQSSESIRENKGKTAASVLPPAVGATSSAWLPARTGAMLSS
jgi:hypothetical protein